MSDEETLHFLVPTPEGRLDNGKLNPTFLTPVDTEGLSVLRDSAEDYEFETTLTELRPRWQDKNRRLEGVMSFTAASVRHSEGERLCCVYDTGMANKPNHADLMAPPIGVQQPSLSKSELGRQQRRRLKAIIDCIGNNFTPAIKFRGGLFAASE